MNVVRVLAAACLGLAAAGPTPPAKPAEARGGEAVCMFMYVSGGAVMAERCWAGQDPALEAALKASRTRLQAYVLRNELLTPAAAAALRQGGDAQYMPQDKVCAADNQAVYLMWKDIGAAKLHEATEAVVSQLEPRPGSCL